jgi:hypothetical protein
VVEVRVTLHQGALDRLLRRPGGPVYDNVVAGTLLKTRAIATVTAPTDTGFLKNNTSPEIDAGAGSMHGSLIYHAFYAIFVMKGTGLHGPTHSLIHPKFAEHMVFRGRDGSLVVTRTTKGQRAQPFLRDAFIAASPWPVTLH